MKYIVTSLICFFCFQINAQECGINFGIGQGVKIHSKKLPFQEGFPDKQNRIVSEMKNCLDSQHINSQQKSRLATEIAASYYYYTKISDSVRKYVQLSYQLDKDWFHYHLIIAEQFFSGTDEIINSFRPFYLTDEAIQSEFSYMFEFDQTPYLDKYFASRNNIIASNKGYAEELEQVKINDQTYRGEDGIQDKEKQALLDQQNRNQLDSLYNVYNFPSMNIVGSSQSLTPWLVLQHSTDCTWNKKWIKRFLDAYQAGNIKKGLLTYTFNRFYNPEDGYCRKENQEAVEQFMQELKETYPPEFAETFGYENY